MGFILINLVCWGWQVHLSEKGKSIFSYHVAKMAKAALNWSCWGRGGPQSIYSYQFDVSVSNRCLVSNRQGSHVSRRAPAEQQEGIPSTAASNSESSETLLKCLHTSCSTGNKQQEFEMCTRLQSFDLAGITEVAPLSWNGRHFRKVR